MITSGNADTAPRDQLSLLRLRRETFRIAVIACAGPCHPMNSSAFEAALPLWETLLDAGKTLNWGVNIGSRAKSL
jgi:hypothetical protein